MRVMQAKPAPGRGRRWWTLLALLALLSACDGGGTWVEGVAIDGEGGEPTNTQDTISDTSVSDAGATDDATKADINEPSKDMYGWIKDTEIGRAHV